MNSPLHPDTPMQSKELEPGLMVNECPKSGGLWIPLQPYLSWKEQQPEIPIPTSDEPATAQTEEPKHKALLCPESGRLLLRYRVGHGLPFYISRSPATGGVWLEKGEWEALKTKGLHVSLHLICTAGYQRQIRSAVYTQTLTDTFRDRIGAEDFAKVSEFAAWLTRHPKGRDICCYLADQFDQKIQPEPPDTGQPGHRQSVERDKYAIAQQQDEQSDFSEQRSSHSPTQKSTTIASSNKYVADRKPGIFTRIFKWLAIAGFALFIGCLVHGDYTFRNRTKSADQLKDLERDSQSDTQSQERSRLRFQTIGFAGLGAFFAFTVVSGLLRRRSGLEISR